MTPQIGGGVNIAYGSALFAGAAGGIPGFVRMDFSWYEANRPTFTGAGSDYYVDADVAGPGSGTELDPWKAIASANSAVAAGDTVHLAGTFPTGEKIAPAVSGSLGSGHIRYKQWEGKTQAWVVGDGGGGYPAAWLTGKSYIWLDGLKLDNRGQSEDAVTLTSTGSNNVVMNCTISSDNHGIKQVTQTDSWIEGNTITNCGSEAGNTSECVWMQDACDDSVVYNNDLQLAGHSALSLGLQTELAGTHNRVRVARNRVNNAWACGIIVNGATDSCIIEGNDIWESATSPTSVSQSPYGIQLCGNANIVRYNRIWGVENQGIFLQSYFLGITQNCTNNKVYNNSVWNCGGCGLYMFAGDETTFSSNVVENNIFWANNQGSLDEGHGYYQSNWYPFWINLSQSGPNLWAAWSDGANNWDDFVGNVVRNNLISRTTSDTGFALFVKRAGTGNSVTYADKAALEAVSLTTGTIENNLEETDPSFVSTVYGNPQFLYIDSDSPMIDQGFNTAGLTYLGSAVDLGINERA